jgi:hypothetical protein
MAHEITPAMVTGFSEKLEKFSASLSDPERTLLKGMIDSGQQLSDQALDQARGGATHRAFTVPNFAPKLDAVFFRSVMCW